MLDVLRALTHDLFEICIGLFKPAKRFRFCLLRPNTVGNVTGDAAIPQEFAILRENRFRVSLDPDRFSILEGHAADEIGNRFPALDSLFELVPFLIADLMAAKRHFFADEFAMVSAGDSQRALGNIGIVQVSIDLPSPIAGALGEVAMARFAFTQFLSGFNLCGNIL